MFIPLPRATATAPPPAMARADLSPGFPHDGTSYREFRLHSAFQPIFSPSHRRTVGYEALLRARDQLDQSVPPPRVFESAARHGDVTGLDRLARSLHVHNFVAAAGPEVWLFLNLHPEVAGQGAAGRRHFTTGLLRDHGLSPTRVVIEILEHGSQDKGLLTESMVHFRENGYLIALDDFGAGESNFDRIWRLRPDIVKLDRSLVVNAVHNPAARRMLPGLVALIHEVGCLVLLEGIETDAEALIAMDSDADLLQGFHFAKPGPLVPDGPRRRMEFQELSARFRSQATQESLRQEAELAPIVEVFRQSARDLANGTSLDQAVVPLWNFSAILRNYLLDSDGIQVGRNLERRSDLPGHGNRFSAVADVEGADWSRKAYYRRAMSRPGQVQVVGPYLSIPDVAMCLTLSLALQTGGRTRVLCCDLEWRGHANLLHGSLGG
ncbi:MAG: EAL domain-containing protein [Magnetococcales bacterium]|nr:EAL domain-containing protein [Magnetococcales bacterium]